MLATGGRRGHGKVESCALTQFAFGPDTSPMTVDDSLYRCQSNTSPRKIDGLVQTLERGKEPACVFHIKARPVVVNKIDGSLILLHRADGNPGLRQLLSKLPRVIQQ